MQEHPFDRYAAFTDLQALKEASSKPLRKTVRVNTLKCSIEEFKTWAGEKGWSLTPVPWCKEGFFVDREDRTHALGRDLRHLLGHFYMQEASSQLPAALVDAQPGEAILDLCAAPGSKTTQMADAMKGSGVIVANEPQEKRMRILKTAIHRTGATNVILVKKAGQWFAKHMTERFDRVLCDAPCTAQGTIRKDPTALNYCSTESISAAARLQMDLLETAIHAAKIGGRIVYSTCTLTPEENEVVAQNTLNKFCDQLEVLDPRESMVNGQWSMENAINDSLRVQELINADSPFTIHHSPFLRLWPQTYNTEGFFCAVFRKTARTKEPTRMEFFPFEERPLSRRETQSIADFFEKSFGTSFLHEEDALFQRNEQVLLSSKSVSAFDAPMVDYSIGIPFAKDLRDGRFRLTNEAATLRGKRAQSQIMEITDVQYAELMGGKDSTCDPALHGDTVLSYKGIAIGLGLAKEGRLFNRLSRWQIKNAE